MLGLFNSPECRGVTEKFFWGGKAIFLIFFPVENFHFGRPKTNFRRLEKWNAKKKKKKKKDSFLVFKLFPPSIFTFPFTIFVLLFSIFPFFFSSCLFFPGRSAEISRSEVSGGGGHSVPTPPPCYATSWMPMILTPISIRL